MILIINNRGLGSRGICQHLRFIKLSVKLVNKMKMKLNLEWCHIVVCMEASFPHSTTIMKAKQMFRSLFLVIILLILSPCFYFFVCSIYLVIVWLFYFHLLFHALVISTCWFAVNSPCCPILLIPFTITPYCFALLLCFVDILY